LTPIRHQIALDKIYSSSQIYGFEDDQTLVPEFAELPMSEDGSEISTDLQTQGLPKYLILLFVLFVRSHL
jgi:hypothetical protein